MFAPIITAKTGPAHLGVDALFPAAPTT